jgi:hypothetical protein
MISDTNIAPDGPVVGGIDAPNGKHCVMFITIDFPPMQFICVLGHSQSIINFWSPACMIFEIPIYEDYNDIHNKG